MIRLEGSTNRIPHTKAEAIYSTPNLSLIAKSET